MAEPLKELLGLFTGYLEVYKERDMEIKKITVDELFTNSNSEYVFSMYSAESKGYMLPEGNPCKEQYYIMEEAGSLDVLAVMDENKIVGIALILTYTLPHYSTLASTTESLFVLKEYRKYGTGKKLIKAAEEVAKNRGSNLLFISSPINGRLRNASKILGYKETNVILTKEL